MHYYQMNIGDYASHTAHLDPLEDIAYRRMMDWYYLHESPLPESVEQIARIIRMRGECKCIAVVLQEFFTLHSDGYHNNRIDTEIASYRELSDKRKKAANKRWARKNGVCKGDASAMQNECTSNANHKPITNNHKPIKKHIDQSEFDQAKKRKAAEKQERLDNLFGKFWAAGMRKAGKAQAKKAFMTLMKKQDDPETMTETLVNDIQMRISINQYGFNKLHPSTYLNNERWHDELQQPLELSETPERIQPMDNLTNSSWADGMFNAAPEPTMAQLYAIETGSKQQAGG